MFPALFLASKARLHFSILKLKDDKLWRILNHLHRSYEIRIWRGLMVRIPANSDS